MITRGIAALIIFLLIGGTVTEDAGPVADTPLGRVRGYTLTSRGGRKHLAFSGVPYAQPPIGNLRFQDPQPLAPWTVEKDAKQSGPLCMQYGHWFNVKKVGAVIGTEDCLYLDVYTHNVSGKAPVLVAFHGGGFILGNAKMIEPTNLMDEDIVVVNVNYRLGILGFLSFESNDLTGNQGLKDQVMSLKWVKQNIASFGGDPDQVTITGFSAGGASVYYHIISPLSRGLFHRAYASSGTSYNPWALSPPGLAKANALKLMGLIGCPPEPQQALACATKMNATEIVKQFTHFIVFQNIDPLLSFSPVLEEPGPKAFMTHPISKWDHNPVPLLLTLSSAEGLFRSVPLSNVLQEYSDNFETCAPVSLHYWASAWNPEQVTKKVKEFYFPGKKEISQSDFANLTHMYTDSWFSHGIIEGANKHKGTVYFLYFDYMLSQSEDIKYQLGANHCGDNDFVWVYRIGSARKDVQLNEEEIKKSQNYIEMLVNFMKYGVPKIPGTSLNWKTWTVKSNNYVHFNNDGYSLKEGLLKNRFEFWDSLKYKDKFL